MFTLELEWIGLTNENCGYVWLRSSCLRNQLQLVGCISNYNQFILDAVSKMVSIFAFSLNELVQHGKNGFIFESTMELSQQILSWFQDFPKNIALVNIKEAFSHNLREFQQLRWDDNWNQNALPAFTS